MCKEQSELWLNSAYWKPLHYCNFHKYLYNQDIFLNYLNFCVSPTRYFYNHIKQDLKQKISDRTEIPLDNWYFTVTQILSCTFSSNIHHSCVTDTFICIFPLVQPPWFILSPPHPFKNRDSKKKWKYTWFFLFPCQYYPSQNVQNVHGMVCHKAVVQFTNQRELNVSTGHS